jgi:putative MFS transporter
VFVRLRMPESVRYLESRGRHDEAERTVRAFERAAGVPAPDPADVEAAATRATALEEARVTSGSRRASVSALLRDGLRRRTVALWLVWSATNFSYYGAFVWLPTLLVEAGFPLVKSFEYTLLITLAQLPGYAASAWLIERWGRRGTLALFLLGSAVAATAFGFGAVSGSATQIVVSGMFLSFFNLGAWGALYAVTPELYPTRLRGTGAGWAAGVGRIASIAAPLTVPPLLVLGGTPVLFAVFGGVFVVAAVAALALPELRGTRLAE